MSVERLPSSPWSRTLAGTAIFTCVLFAGCTKRETADTSGTSQRGNESKPSMDVRGGVSDSEVYLNLRTAGEGKGGPGGSLRITSSGGNITVSDQPLALAEPPPTFTGVGFDVLSGQTREVSGHFVVSYIRIEDGGMLVLTDDTIFEVAGDVSIRGRISGKGDKHSIDGRDLTIDADGIVVITGSIDCSGLTKDLEDVSPVEIEGFAGGHAGEIYIASGATSAGSPGPHVFISGTVSSNGGDTVSQNADTSRPGIGGQILIGSFGQVAVSGRISARGGKCYFTADGSEAHGGSIEIVAVEDVTVANVLELNANGGDSSGPEGGAGGSVLLEAPVGIVNLDDFNVECRGGNATHSAASVAGAGGTVTFTGATVQVDGVSINVSGGDSIEEDSGKGGNGGTAQMAGSVGLTVGPDVVIDADGGETKEAVSDGGTGGSFKVINLDETNPTALDFQGVVSVSGGHNAINSTGPDGTICSAGSNFTSNVNLVGANNFPISGCTENDLETVVVHTLDCDDASIAPSSVTTTLPTVLGVDFYRVVRTATMITNGVTTVTISTTGEAGHNLNLYVGPASALGSTNLADYTLGQGIEVDSAESLDIDVSGLAAGGFVAVLVVEFSTLVEEYTISVACN